jgi:hypothetical protein
MGTAMVPPGTGIRAGPAATHVEGGIFPGPGGPEEVFAKTLDSGN